MNSQLNSRLIQAMQEHLPQKSNLASVLMDVLSIGKEAAYRRLRGDVIFSFDDVAKISRRLGISVDKIISESKIPGGNKWAYIDVEVFYSSSKYIEQYSRRLEVLSETFNQMEGQPKATLRCATSLIPYFFTFSYKKLTLFQHYKRLYLTHIKPGFRFSEMEDFSGMYDLEASIINRYRSISRILFILDRNICHSLVKDIIYFFQRNLISVDELLQLKQELLQLISFMEEITATGTFNNNNEIDIYLLDVYLDSSYVHAESASFECSMHWTYFVDTYNLYNSSICKMQKDWIESLKRYSTLITQTGEMQRVEFFNKQRELVMMLDSNLLQKI